VPTQGTRTQELPDYNSGALPLSYVGHIFSLSSLFFKKRPFFNLAKEFPLNFILKHVLIKK
jgi:hypothetical protein